MDPKTILVVAAFTLMAVGAGTIARGTGSAAKAVFYKAPRAVVTKVFHVGHHVGRHPIDSLKDGAVKPGKK